MKIRLRKQPISPSSSAPSLSRPFLLSIFLLILPLNLLAQRREGDLAVLNFIRGKGVPETVNTDFLRRIVMEEAARLTNYRVMTEENVFAILSDKGVDPTRCVEFQCAVEYGRLLQADKVVVGSIEFIEGIYYLNLSLYDAPSASVDRSITRECEGCSFRGLVEKIRETAKEVFGVIETPKKEVEKTGEVRVSVYDEKGNKIIADVYIDGVLSGKSNQSFRVSEGRHFIGVKKEGYKEEKKRIDVKGGVSENYEFRLKLKEKGKERKAGSYFYILSGINGPLAGISEISGPSPLIEAGGSPFSLDGFSLSIGGRYSGSFERDEPQMLIFYLEPLYFFIKRKNFLLGGYSDLWFGGGWMNYDRTYGKIAVNDRLFGLDFGLRMKLYYIAIKTGFSFFNFGGEFTPAIILTGGVDIW